MKFDARTLTIISVCLLSSASLLYIISSLSLSWSW